MKDIFEWERILFNGLPANFLFEVAFRCFVMFAAVLLTLKLTGKRGIKQLSIFELVIIISLGSAAGDPMFYEDVGILPAITVLVSVLLLYRLLTWLISKNAKIDTWIEGKPIYLIKAGKICIKNFRHEDLAIDELFAELRTKNVSHLGQVKFAILEPSGEISLFFYSSSDVIYGLPILPHEFEQKEKKISLQGLYACCKCGNTDHLSPSVLHECAVCNGKEWIAAKNERRVD